jgi:hypothetical protein
MLCAICVALVWTGPVPLTVTPHDIMIPLDGGWRIRQGQIPHNDFYSPLGPLSSFLIAFAMLFTGPTAQAIVFANVIVAVLASLYGWLVARRRFGPAGALVFSTLVALTATAANPIGWDPELSDTAMLYNRHAFALLMTLFVAVLVEPAEGVLPRYAAIEEILGGVALAVVLYVKASFFAIGLLAFALRTVVVHFSTRFIVRAAAGFASVSVFVFVVLGVRPMAFVRDMRLASTVARDATRHLPGAVLAYVIAMPFELAMFAALAVTAAGLLRVRARPRKTERLTPAVAFGVTASFIVASDVILGASNTHATATLVVTPVVAFIALRMVTTGRPKRAGDLVLLAFAVGLVLPGGFAGAKSLTAAASAKRQARAGGEGYQTFGSPAFDDVYVSSDALAWADYPLAVQDGSAMLRRSLPPNARVVTLDFANPFNVGLRLSPPRGDALWWHLGKTFSYQDAPAAERVFAEADFVMLAKRWEPYILPVYGEFLGGHFASVDRSAVWTLLRRSDGR